MFERMSTDIATVGPLAAPPQTRLNIAGEHTGRIFCKANVAEHDCREQTHAQINKGTVPASTVGWQTLNNWSRRP